MHHQRNTFRPEHNLHWKGLWRLPLAVFFLFVYSVCLLLPWHDMARKKRFVSLKKQVVYERKQSCNKTTWLILELKQKTVARF